MIRKYIVEFLELIKEEKIEIYNEFSLQHELGIFLRNRVDGFKIQFERNARYFGIIETIKHEIDIVIFNDSERYAIELKYPMNGQYPEQMYAFIKDICFMEQLKINGFTETYCLAIVEDKNFYSGHKQDGIYAYFRGSHAISGEIIKPTGNRVDKVTLRNSYYIEWKRLGEKYKYYIV